MPLREEQARDPAIIAALGGLLLSVVTPLSTMLGVRAIRWQRDLLRFGLSVPFFVTHDLGLLFAAPRAQLRIGVREELKAFAKDAPPNSIPPAFAEYEKLLQEIAGAETSLRAESLRLSDELVVVLLLRILGGQNFAKPDAKKRDAGLPLDPDLLRDLDRQLVALYRKVPREAESRALDRLSRGRLQILTLVDALDLDTLRLVGMLGPEASAKGALAEVDLLAAISTTAANDVVNFSLELLPSILETRRNATTSAFAAHGYAGVGNKGSLDSMVLTELAWDDAEFGRRYIDNEILYYTRERSSEEARRLHYVLIDASASMRGERQVFARGLAIALGKKLQLAGEEVWFRFFDSRLYEVQRARPQELPIAHLLGFKGERGRNPARVFAQLGTELALLRARDGREPLIHLLTHAALHIPRAIVADVREVARISGVFILPSGGELELDYLDLLESHTVVDHSTLSERNRRAKAATAIVDQASKRAEDRPKSALEPPIPR